MRRFFILIPLLLLVSGCAGLQKDWGIITGSTVSPQAVVVAGNAFNALEGTATSYLSFCKANKALPACAGYVAVRKKIIPAVRSGRVARNNLEAFLVANPGQLGPSGLYNALIAAVNTLQQIASQYSVPATAPVTAAKTSPNILPIQ